MYYKILLWSFILAFVLIVSFKVGIRIFRDREVPHGLTYYQGDEKVYRDEVTVTPIVPFKDFESMCIEAFKKDYPKESANKAVVYWGWDTIHPTTAMNIYNSTCHIRTCPLIKGEMRANSYTKDVPDCTDKTEKFYDFYLNASSTKTL